MLRGRAVAARLVHTQEVVGSSPIPATKYRHLVSGEHGGMPKADAREAVKVSPATTTLGGHHG